MINNKIHYVNDTEATKIVNQVKEQENLFLMELHGKEIQSWEDYVNKLDAYINFPTSCLSNISGVARYHDWITDLDWLEKDGYVLIIYDYNSFLEEDSELKEEIIEDFETLILPWWQGEDENSVVNCVVEGEAKPFSVYLVE